MNDLSPHTPIVQENQDFILLDNHWKIKKNDISAVFITKLATYKRYPITAGVIFILIAASCSSLICGLLGIVCILSSFFMKAKYVLRIKINTGEIRPLVSTNKVELETIRKEIEKAVMSNSTDFFKPVSKEE